MGERGRLLVISGPSGSGKSTIAKRLLEDPRIEFSVSATTRPMRAGEVDGRDYHFVGRERFRELVDQGAFIEWADVHGNLYGTLREPLERALAAGRIYLLEIDVQGANKLQAIGVEALYVFLAPPDMSALRARLVGRGTDAPDVIERRLQRAELEMQESRRYDHVLVNTDLERTLAEVRRLAGLDRPRAPAQR